MNKIEVPLSEVRATVEGCLGRLGLQGVDLEVVRDVLLYAEMRGNSQGFAKIIERTIEPDPQAGEITIVVSRGASCRIDGARNLGMVVCQRAVGETVAGAGEHGIFIATTFNTSSSTGAIGYYATQMAEAGYIGMVMAGSAKVVAPAGGIDPVYGTNPIAIAIPTGEEPLVLDMSTAATTWFSLISARDSGAALEEGVAVAGDGQPTTDPVTAMQGALRAFGGHKGAGLALMIEILTGPLTGAGIVGDDDAAANRGCTFIAIDPGFLIGDHEFRTRVDALCAAVKAGRADGGEETVTLPGERARARAREAVDTGLMRVDSVVYGKLRALCGDAG